MKETMNMTANNQEAVKVDSQVSKDLAEQAVKNQVVENLDGQENEIEKKPVSVSELKANMETYRANIKKGETKNERGQYDEALVLENEAKLKETENEIQRIEEEERKAQKISELQKEIAGYRDLISEAEKKNNETDVLENENKLRTVEQQILNIKKYGLEPKVESYNNDEPVFVEADPNLPIEKRLSETADGLEEWQIQQTDRPGVFKINRGFGWGEISKAKLEEMMKEAPVHQEVEKEISKIREELATENSTDNDLFNRAKEIILQEKKASASLLQEQLGIDYLQAGELIDKMEKDGVIGSYNGNKTREILINTETADNNKNWISDHFKNFEDDAEKTPEPVETAKKESKPLWKKMADFWTSDKGKNLWSWKKKK